MVKRKKQIITSPYGVRGEIFHKGVDLRCYNFMNWKKQPIVFPEQCRVIRVGYQEQWGFNVVCRTKNESGLKDYVLKFIHLEKPKVKINNVYKKGDLVGWTTVTDYMKEHGYYEHLHFETYEDDYTDLHFNPIKYFDERGIQYADRLES